MVINEDAALHKIEPSRLATTSSSNSSSTQHVYSVTMKPGLILGIGPSKGPLFFGTILNVMLYGVAIGQMVEYILTCKYDRLWLKTFVTVLFSVASFECIVTTTKCYISVVGSSPSDDLLKLAWYVPANVLVSVSILLGAQSFYAYRIRRLSGSNLIAVVLLTLTLIQTVAGLVAAVTTTSDRIPSWYPNLIMLWYVGVTVSDSAIAITLVTLLYRMKTGLASTDTLISSMIRVTIQTGLVTTLFTIISFTLYLTRGFSSMTYLILTIPYHQLYLNSLISMLNARQRWDPHRYDTTWDGPVVDHKTHSPMQTQIVLGISDNRALSPSYADVGQRSSIISIDQSPSQISEEPSHSSYRRSRMSVEPSEKHFIMP